LTSESATPLKQEILIPDQLPSGKKNTENGWSSANHACKVSRIPKTAGHRPTMFGMSPHMTFKWNRYKQLRMQHNKATSKRPLSKAMTSRPEGFETRRTPNFATIFSHMDHFHFFSFFIHFVTNQHTPR